MSLRSALDILYSREGIIRQKGFVKLHKDWFAMSFVVALSEYKIYSIMRAEDSINTKIIKHYFESIFAEGNLSKKARKHSFALVWDYASVNTINEAIHLYLWSKIRIITLLPYTPSLNPTEKLNTLVCKKMTPVQKKETHVAKKMTPVAK